jgi:hypothetical protein
MRLKILLLFLLLFSTIRLWSQPGFSLKFQWSPCSDYNTSSDFFKRSIADADSGFYVMMGPYNWENEYIPVINYDSTEFSGRCKGIPEGVSFSDEIKFSCEIAYDRGNPLLYLKIYPLRKAQDGISAEVLMSAKLRIDGVPDSALDESDFDTRQIRAANSVLSSGHWYKMRVYESGVYMIDHARFVAMGFPSSVISDQIRIYGNGGEALPESNATVRPDDLTENAILIDDGGDGLFDNASDRIIFYGEGTKVWKYNDVAGEYSFSAHPYDTLSAYFITVGPGQGLRISDSPAVSGPSEKDIFSYDYLCYHERNDVNLLHSGKEWLGEDFRLQPDRNFVFDVPGVIDSLPARINVGFVARSFQPSTLDIVSGANSLTLNIPKTDAGQNTDYAKEAIAAMDIYPESTPIALQLNYNISDPNALAWLNYIRITAGASLNFTAPVTIFRAAASYGTSVVTYHLGNVHPQIQIWDVTNPLLPQRVSANIIGNTAVFKSHGDLLRSFIAFDGSSWLTTIDDGVVQSQNLHGMPTPDYIIITHENFTQQAERLADFHRQHNDLETVVVSTEEVYNEFSSGKKDVAALRDFVRMFYERESDPDARPRYLLLFGDGSYDPLERLHPHSDFVPTYQTLNSYTPTASYVTDDFFALLDPGEGQNAAGLPDIGVGRLTIKSTAEADLVIDKIIRYSATDDLTDTLNRISGSLPVVSNLSGWRNNISFIADDEDGNLHMKQADGISAVVDSLGYGVIEKLYFDAFKQYTTPQGPRYPDINHAIQERIRKGALIVNYTGHGGETGWASENVLGLQDIFTWNNYFNLPVFVTATCEFSRYDDPGEVSAGEHILLHEKGGGIALFSTTRVAYAHSNEIINRFLLKSLFTVTDGKYPAMGDAMRNAKVMCGTGVYMQNFTLLGDPALKLACPAYRVITDSINGKAAAGFSDTVSNGQTISVSGHIEDFGNIVQIEFNGFMDVEVYDKPSRVTTLANDFNNTPYTFYASQFGIVPRQGGG